MFILVLLFCLPATDIVFAEPLRLETVPMNLDAATPDQDEQSQPQASAASTPPKTVAKDKPKANRLFGYVEFRGPLGNMPKWQRVLDAEHKLPSFNKDGTASFNPAVAARWEKVRESVKDKTLQEQVKAVNSFFNQWPYKTDMMIWGVEDYWETPREFVEKSGDCEDYAIAKYYALRSLGVPASQMRIVAVIEKIRGIGHAILIVYMDDNAFVLDNLSNMILPHYQLQNYEPKFSVNEEYRWAHVKPVSQPVKK